MDIKTKKKIESFFKQFVVRQFRKGETLLNPNKNYHDIYFVANGFIREYAISQQGVETSLHIFTAGSYFPMMWVLADIPNRYYYEAFTNVVVYEAPKDKVLLFIKKNPDVLMELNKRIFQAIDKLLLRVESLTLSSAHERIVSILLYLSRHFGKLNEGKIIINNQLTHRDVASLAGVTRETASRELEKLAKIGIIRYKNKTIVVDDLSKLKRELATK